APGESPNAEPPPAADHHAPEAQMSEMASPCCSRPKSAQGKRQRCQHQQPKHHTTLNKRNSAIYRLRRSLWPLTQQRPMLDTGGVRGRTTQGHPKGTRTRRHHRPCIRAVPGSCLIAPALQSPPGITEQGIGYGREPRRQPVHQVIKPGRTASEVEK